MKLMRKSKKVKREDWVNPKCNCPNYSVTTGFWVY